jgi:DNA-binding winged helix-turn-helix (wHTH) protein
MELKGIFQFGKFRIDALTGTVRREDAIVTLNRRAFDVLLYLVQNPGKVVTRDELLKECLVRYLRGREPPGAKHLRTAAGA